MSSLVIRAIEVGPPILVHMANGRSVQFSSRGDLEELIRNPPESSEETLLRHVLALIIEADPTLQLVGAIRDRTYHSQNPTWGAP